jgi:histone-lysine N-methyltransferase SETMAR
MNDSTSFAIMRLFFHKVSIIFNKILPTLSKTLHTGVVKFPPQLGAHHERYKETSNKLRKRIHRVRPNRNTKDALLLHDNALPHTSLLTRGAIAEMRRTLLPHPAHSLDLAPSDCHLFGRVKCVLHGRHFAHDSELKQSFRDVLRSRDREFYNTGIQHLTQRWRKCVENDGDFVEK